MAPPTTAVTGYQGIRGVSPTCVCAYQSIQGVPHIQGVPPTCVTAMQAIRGFPPVHGGGAAQGHGPYGPQPLFVPPQPVAVSRARMRTEGSGHSVIARPMDDLETETLSQLLHHFQMMLHPQAVSVDINMSKKIAYYTTQDGQRYEVDLVNEVAPMHQEILGRIEAAMHRVSPPAVRHAEWKKGERGLSTGPKPLQRTPEMNLPKTGAGFARDHLPKIIGQHSHSAGQLEAAKRVHMAELLVQRSIEQCEAHIKQCEQMQDVQQKSYWEGERAKLKNMDLFAVQCALAFYRPQDRIGAFLEAEQYLAQLFPHDIEYACDVASLLLDRVEYVTMCKERKRAIRQSSHEDIVLKAVLSITHQGSHVFPAFVQDAQRVHHAQWNPQATPGDLQNQIIWLRNDLGLPPN